MSVEDKKGCSWQTVLITLVVFYVIGKIWGDSETSTIDDDNIKKNWICRCYTNEKAKNHPIWRGPWPDKKLHQLTRSEAENECMSAQRQGAPVNCHLSEDN
jgi:hypothetical protein